MIQGDGHQYDDIINLPHHRSSRHPQMSMDIRAAQFAPFAALTGHEAALQETARLTDERIDLDEDEKEVLNQQIQLIREHLGEAYPVRITCFQPDSRKAGGVYVNMTGIVKKIDEYGRRLILTDESIIPIDDILSLNIPEGGQQGDEWSG